MQLICQRSKVKKKVDYICNAADGIIKYHLLKEQIKEHQCEKDIGSYSLLTSSRDVFCEQTRTSSGVGRVPS